MKAYVTELLNEGLSHIEKERYEIFVEQGDKHLYVFYLETNFKQGLLCKAYKVRIIVDQYDK